MSTNQLQNLSEANSVGEWVAADFRLASVFSRHGIDFCCGGGKPVDQACAEQGISVETLLHEAQDARLASGIGEQYNQWSVDFLADYIAQPVSPLHPGDAGADRPVRRHRRQCARRGAPGDGDDRGAVAAVCARLTAHLRDEEELLFPYIKQLAQRPAAGGPVTPPAFGSAQALIAQMGAEHEEVGATLGEIERLSGGYAVPADGCNTYRALYGFLGEFEATTKKHIHLENNILFPKAIRLEQEQARARAPSMAAFRRCTGSVGDRQYGSGLLNLLREIAHCTAIWFTAGTD